MIKHRSKLLLIVAVLLAALLLGGCSGSDVKVGFVAPLSGPNAGEGRAAYNAFELAFKQAELPFEVEIVPVDDESDAAKGAEAVAKLLTDNRVMAAAGFYNTPVASSSLEHFVNAHCPLIIWGTNAAALTAKENYPYVLRALGTEQQENAILADFVCDDLDKKLVYIVSDTSTAAIERAEDFGSRITVFNGALKGMVAVAADAGDTELTTLAASIVAKGSNVVYYTGDADLGGKLALAVRQMNSNIVFCTTSGVAGSAFMAAAGKAAAGTVAVRQGIDLQATEAGKEFVAAYNAAGFEEPMGTYSVQAYNAAQLIIAAMQKAENINREAIADVLKTGGLNTILGDTSFSLTGQVMNAAFYPVVCKDGSWQSYALVNAAAKE